MSIISSIVRRPVTMLMAILLLVAFSIFTASRLSIDFLPDVEFPEVTVMTQYTGANPEEIEENITKPIEESISGVANLESISSRSTSGSSIINVTFKYGTGLDQNVSNLQERIDRVSPRLPTDAGAPTIFRFSSNDVPIMDISISSNRSINDAREYVENNLLSYFEQTDGVANVNISGGQTKKVFVETSVDRLNAFDLTLTAISNAISANGQRSSLGYITTDVSSMALVLDNKYSDIEELNNLVIAEKLSDSRESYFIRLRDVADIRIGYDETSVISLFNQRPSISMNIFKLNDANIIEVSERVRTTIKKVESIAPNDFEFTIVDDNSTFIKDSVSAVTQAASGGGVLAILVLLLFLRNFSSVLVIAISMPISILLTLMLMYFAGLTINFMSLAGLTLGIGMLVDNSVVILEHIYNKRLKGVRLIPAAEYGAREMARPVLASTLTTVLVFAPLLLFKNELGTTGGFFSELAFTVVVSVLASYCAATFIVPIFASKYIPLYRAKHKGLAKILDDFSEKKLFALNRNYRKILTKILETPKRYIALILILAFSPILLVKNLGFSFIPEFAPESVSINFFFPTTMKLNEMYTIVEDFEKRTDGIFTNVGIPVGNKLVDVREQASSGIFSRGGNSGSYSIFYTSDITPALHREIVAEFLVYKNIYPGVRIIVSGGGSGRRRSGGSASGFTMELKSNDYKKLQATASAYTNLIKNGLGGEKITNLQDDQPDSSLEYELSVDRPLANSYGVTVSSLVTEVQTAVQGKNTNKFKDGAEEYDILLRLNKGDRSQTNLTEQLYINNNKGARVPVANFINKNYSLGVNEIRRSDFQRTIKITGDLVGDYTSTEAVADVRDLLSTIPRDEDVSYTFTGEYEDLSENFRILGIVFILAVLFIYGIMASQFESFLDPFIIIFTVPLTFAGVILIYFFTGNTISSFTIVGIVMLVGIAVNHGIVLVDYINLLRNRGMDLKQAIVQGGGSRLQPILMTSATTILGLMPIVVLNINGVTLIKPLALTVVGGLTMSALLSLYFIPLIYFMFHRKLVKISHKKAKRRQEKEAYTVMDSEKYSELM